MAERPVIAPFRLAFQALAANKLRSVLTMLGNIIGVMCVVALVNIGISGREKIQGSLSSIGQNMIFVFPRFDADAETPSQRWRPLELADVRAIQNGCPSIAGVSPVTDIGARVTFGNQHTGTQVQGVWPSYLSIRDWGISRGLPFTDADLHAGSKVCLLGQTVVNDLFGNLDPVGQTIRINRQPFLVLGVLDRKGTFLTGQDQDKTIIVPISAIHQRLTGGRGVKVVYVSARLREEIPKVKEEIRAAVRQSQKLPPDRRDSVETQDLGSMAMIVDSVVIAATALLAAIAFISLLVGGIGIMNIMLVSVTERTREIGLRMAVGATDLDVLMQFLIEALVLSAIGGVFGVIFGIGLSTGVALLFEWPLTVNLISLAVAVAFSAAVGIFFGLYPAWRASQLDPITALRHE
ncbi:MAG TPA: ABC transporter permease [Planctomycetota bacterium]|nr:ABC transporter permease [Planctomycetota bacterium]